MILSHCGKDSFLSWTVSLFSTCEQVSVEWLWMYKKSDIIGSHSRLIFHSWEFTKLIFIVAAPLWNPTTSKWRYPFHSPSPVLIADHFVAVCFSEWETMKSLDCFDFHFPSCWRMNIFWDISWLLFLLFTWELYSDTRPNIWMSHLFTYFSRYLNILYIYHLSNLTVKNSFHSVSFFVTQLIVSSAM